MGLLDNAAAEYADRMDTSPPDADSLQAAPTRVGAGAGSFTLPTTRQGTVMVDGTPVPLEEVDTTQTTEETTWLTGTGHGQPRGRRALEARKVSQTAAMEAITNGIVDQVVGGDLIFDSDDEDVDQSEAELQALLRDILHGPHPMGNDLDDLLTAATADMIGPGNAYWQMVGSADDSLPVAALIPLDPLTIRHNVERNGLVPEDEPPYWQVRNAFTSEGIANMGAVEPTPLQEDDLAVMHYWRGKRSYQFYPKSPSLQVLEWLEILTNSTTHHNRFYADNEVPPGFIQILQASETTVSDVQESLQNAKGDPRSVEVIGGEGQAMWVEMGGTAVNLDVIEEQRWFFQLCLGSLGLGKAELGFIEDANRANGEVEQTRVYKRVAQGLTNQFNNAFRHIAAQFDVYNALDRPFTPTIEHSDPSAQRAKEERLQSQYSAGLVTYNDFLQARGTNPADVDTTVVIGDTVVDYGDKPRFVVQELLAEARSGDASPAAEPGADEDDEEQAVIGARAGGEAYTNGS